MRLTFARSVVVAASVTLLAEGTVAAQGLGPARGAAVRPVPTPAFSPYLNLLRRENPTYLNYYGLVRPQQDFRQAVIGLRQDIATNRAAIETATGPDGAMVPTTGHRSYFMNTAGYFQTIGGAAGPGGLTPGISAGRPAATAGAGAPAPAGGAASGRPVPAGGGSARSPAGARR